MVVSGTGSPATEVLVIQNPSDETATAAVTTFVGGEEQVLADEVEVPAAGRATLILEEATLGGPFAVLIESDRPVITERRLFFGDDEDTAGSSPSRWPAPSGCPSRSSDGCPLVDCRGAGSDRARRGLVPPPAPSYPSRPARGSPRRSESSAPTSAAPAPLAAGRVHGPRLRDVRRGPGARREPGGGSIDTREVRYETDPDLYERYGVDACPLVILVDADGAVRASHHGPVTLDELERSLGAAGAR